jgi:endonuclease/exonuclease/phosphatase family metal-dependent hydrolase
MASRAVTDTLTPLPLGAPATEPLSSELGSVFSLSTWNVWFDKHHRESRFRALLDVLRCHAPTIMAFQEVTLPFVRVVQESDWLTRGHWISAVDPNNLGTAMIGRAQPLQLRWLELPSAMGRRLLLADFEGALRIGVVHLESLAARELRQEQLRVAFAALKEVPHSILLGDFNFPDGAPECAALDPDFQDAWPLLQPATPGYTRDTLANPMGRLGRQEKQQRLDRILFRGLNVLSVQLLGDQPFAPGLFPSDHFGLLARFQKG